MACFVMLSVGVAKAQTEITVEPGLNTLSDALTANPGATLILQREGDYAVTGTIVINVPTIIKGETEPADARPALITYSALPGEGEGKPLFNVGASCTFQNFGVIGYTDDAQHIGNIFVCTAPNISITIDGCNIQGANQVLSTGQDGLIIVMKNNIMYNICGTIWDNWCGFGSLWGNGKGDFKSYNNTIFTAGRVFNFGGGGPDGAEAMEHNTYVNGWGDTFYPMYNEKVTVRNNIFFNTQMRAYVGVLKDASGTQTWAGDFTDWAAKEIPVTDVLAGDAPVFIHAKDTLADGTPNPVHRAVNINNNLKFYDKTVLDFYAANPIIVKQPFMPKTMKEVFAPKYGWNIDGNMLEEEGKAVDPQFAMGAIPAGAFEMAFKTRLNRHLPTAEADPAFPFEIAWRPGGEERGEFIWPLPFNFKPTNAAVLTAGTDGYPLGDLNWFGKDVVKAWEEGKANPTSVKNIKNESGKTAYISQNMLRFKGFDKAVDAEIYSILGQKVLVAKNISELNVSNLKRGVYLVKVNNGQSYRVVK